MSGKRCSRAPIRLGRCSLRVRRAMAYLPARPEALVGRAGHAMRHRRHDGGLHAGRGGEGVISCCHVTVGT
jgi:hypothetical protein